MYLKMITKVIELGEFKKQNNLKQITNIKLELYYLTLLVKEIEKEVQCLGYYLMIMLMVVDLLKSKMLFSSLRYLTTTRCYLNSHNKHDFVFYFFISCSISWICYDALGCVAFSLLLHLKS